MRRVFGRNRIGKKRLIILTVAVVFGLAAIGGVWFFVTKSKSSQRPVSTTTEQAAEPTVQVPPDPTPVVYKSDQLGIEITHRKDWTLKQDPDGKQLTITSPPIVQLAADGSAKNGVFTLKIRKGATDAMVQTIEKAVAVRDSEVIGYTAPTESQRYYTNVSYAGQGDAFQFFIVTGSIALKTSNPFAFALTFSDDTFLLAGGYGADRGNSLLFDLAPASAIDSTAEEQAIAIVESLKIF